MYENIRTERKFIKNYLMDKKTPNNFVELKHFFNFAS